MSGEELSETCDVCKESITVPVLWPLPAPTVKPGRDAVLAALLTVEAGPSTNALADAVLAILPGKTDREVRADERSKIARSLRNMRTTDDGKPVGAFLNVADWLDTLDALGSQRTEGDRG